MIKALPEPFSVHLGYSTIAINFVLINLYVRLRETRRGLMRVRRADWISYSDVGMRGGGGSGLVNEGNDGSLAQRRRYFRDYRSENPV